MLIGTLEVQVTNEHLNKLSKIRPLKALTELIWNSLDADATEIIIDFERNPLGGIEEIYITDNGCGIGYHKIEEQFGKLGDSYKAHTKTSSAGRKYHGKLGQGRYSGFALGKHVTWESVFEEGGILNEFTISGDSSELKSFKLSDVKKTKRENTGVIVSVTMLIDEKANQIANKDKLLEELSIIFAPYLFAYPGISIIVEGQILNPSEHIIYSFDEIIDVHSDVYGPVSGILKIHEWKTGNHKNFYLCNAEGITYEEENSGVRSSFFPHTAYLQSDVIEKLSEDNQLDVRELIPQYCILRDAAHEKLKGIYREKLAKEATKEVKRLKEENVYPYVGEPQSVIEVAERQVFDICAVKVNQLLPDFSKLNRDSKQFTYRLLKEALQSSPNSLSKILNEVLNLTIEQQEEFAALLEKTSLKSIINTTRLISNRLSFVNGLEEILYGEEYQKKLKERSQLHKILLGELWLFGEQYTYGFDDISLKSALKKHLHILGRDSLLEEIDFKNVKGLDDIPDIGLYRQFAFGSGDNFENLIIELKRPSCVIGIEELNQIEKYAVAIEDNEYFDKEKTKWKIILLGIKMDNFARKKVGQKDRKNGLLYTGVNLEVWVHEWNQVIQEAKGRYGFLKEKLEWEVKDNEEGLKYLRERYKEYLPH